MLSDIFADHTYRVVILGTAIVGCVAAVLGCFLYVRKQSLLSDVIAHSALPGTMLAFLLAVTVLGIDGRNSVLLVAGAVLMGTLATLLTHAIVRVSRVASDAAMAVTLTAFFGLGMWLLDVINSGDFAGKGGIHDYLFGNASVVTVADVTTTAIAGALALAIVITGWHVFVACAFDTAHAAMQGVRVRLADVALYAAIVLAVVIGAKSVGLVLMVACVITPAAAARQWVRSMPALVWLAALIGGVSGIAGAILSITLGGVPTGPVTVLVLFGCFVISLLCAPRRGIVSRVILRTRARAQLARQVGDAVAQNVGGRS